MKRSVIFLLIVLIFMQMEAVEFKKFELENGLRVIIYENSRLPKVAMYLAYDVGAMDEEEGQTGIAHVVEHMMFNGTETLGKQNDIDNLIKSAGGYTNAYTSGDHTNYYIVLPSYNVELALRIEADRMKNAIMDEDILKNEMKVIWEEKEQTIGNNPMGRYWTFFNKRFYETRSMQHPIIGYDEDLKAMNIANVRKFYELYYRPNNAVLVLAGDITYERAGELVKKYFNDIQPSEIKNRIKAEPFKLGRGYTEHTMKDPQMTQYNLYIYIPAPTLGHPDHEVNTVLTSLMAGSSTSRLQKLLVDTGIANYVSASNRQGRADHYMVFIAAFTGEKDMERGKEIIFNEFERAKKKTFSKRDIQKIKNNIEADEVLNRQNVAEIGRKLSVYETYYKAEYLNEYIEKLKNITPKDVRSTAQKYFNKDNMMVFYFIPGSDNSGVSVLPEDEVRLNKKPDIPEIVTIDPQLIKDRFEYLREHKKYTLNNGMKVMVLQEDSVEGIFFRINIKAGPSFAIDKNGIPQLMFYCLNEGTKKYKFEKFQDLVDFYALNYNLNIGFETLGISGSFMTKFKDRAMDMISQMLIHPTFPEFGLQKVKQQVLSAIRYSRMKPDDINDYELFKAIYGEDHPYVVEDYGNINTVTNATRKDMLDFYNEFIIPENITITVVGNLPADELYLYISKYFGKWKKSGTVNEIASFERPSVTNESITKKMRFIRQGIANFGFAGLDYNTDDEQYLSMVTSLLGGGSLSSILGEKVRLQQGLAYYVYAFHVTRSSGGYIRIQAGISPENIDKFKELVIATLKDISKKGFDAEEVKRTKNRLFGSYVMGFENNSSIANLLDHLDYRNKSMDDFFAELDRYADATPEKLLEIYNKYFTDDWIFLSIIPEEN